LRFIFKKITAKEQGIHIHNSSLFKTVNPR